MKLQVKKNFLRTAICCLLTFAGAFVSHSATAAAAVPQPYASASYAYYVKITWSATSNATYGYNIYRSTSTSWANRVYIGRTTSKYTTTFYDYSGIAGKKYYYWVCPRPTTSSFYYNTSKYDWGKRTGAPVPQPYASISYANYVKLTWSTNADATYGYYIFRSTSTSWANRVRVGTVSSKNTTTFYDYSAVAGVKYYYWVCPRPTTSGYLYNTSKYDWGKRTGAPVQKPVVSISYANYVKITWSANANATYGYNIYRSTSTSWANRVYIGCTTSKTATTFYDYSAVAGVKYYYWVCPRPTTSTYLYNTSQYDWGWRTGAPVQKPYASISYANYVKLTWSTNADATYGYYIFRSTSTSWANRVRIGTVSSKYTTTFYDYTATAGVKYYYWVCPRPTTSGYLYNTSKYDWGRCY